MSLGVDLYGPSTETYPFCNRTWESARVECSRRFVTSSRIIIIGNNIEKTLQIPFSYLYLAITHNFKFIDKTEMSLDEGDGGDVGNGDVDVDEGGGWLLVVVLFSNGMNGLFYLLNYN